MTEDQGSIYDAVGQPCTILSSSGSDRKGDGG